ncbi:MAG: hypothetical protein II827_02690 [Paludibacteraceae bacterium]|nr:hypothetical protein [Paludibacteraceae bacterium]
MRKFFSFFAMAAVVLSMASCGDGGNTPEQPKPVGAIKGKFSVAPGKQVYFSKGNLQATTSDRGYGSWTWSFATNQWDFIGNQVANNAIKGRSAVSDNGSVDLFIWSNSDLCYGIHVLEDHFDPLVDWGNNPISNGGNEPNLWRTLTQDEWVYLLQTREDAANKYGFAKVNDIPGGVFLPDEWIWPSGLEFTPGKTGTSTKDGDWSEVAATNIYDINQWHAMEENGAVFLPAAGDRNRTDVFADGYVGFYWSATLVPDGTKACYFTFYNSSRIYPSLAFDRNEYGLSVRLVQDVK